MTPAFASSQGENILQVELDMPNRTTRDYEGPTIAPKIQAALDAALQDEEDIDVDGRFVVNTQLQILLTGCRTLLLLKFKKHDTFQSL